MTKSKLAVRRCVGDRGSAALEAPVAVTALLLVMVFVFGAARIMTNSGEVGSAARAGARAAAAARTSTEAKTRATSAVTSALDESACGGSPNVSVLGWAPGEAVTVSVTCTTDMSGLRALFRSDRTVTKSAVEYVDELRGEDGG